MPVRVLNVSAISRKLNRVRDALREKPFLDRVGRSSVRHTQERTQAGVDADGKAFKPLSRSTIDNRLRLAETNKTSAHFAPTLSNLHLTGQLVRSIRFVIEKLKVVIDLKDARKPYKNLDGSRAKNTPTNKQLLKYLKDQGRRFLGVDSILRQKIREIAVRQIKTSIRRENRKRR